MHVFHCRLENSGLSAALHGISLQPMMQYNSALSARELSVLCERFPRPQDNSTIQRNVASIQLYQDIANDFGSRKFVSEINVSE